MDERSKKIKRKERKEGRDGRKVMFKSKKEVKMN